MYKLTHPRRLILTFFFLHLLTFYLHFSKACTYTNICLKITVNTSTLPNICANPRTSLYTSISSFLAKEKSIN